MLYSVFETKQNILTKQNVSRGQDSEEPHRLYFTPDIIKMMNKKKNELDETLRFEIKNHCLP